MLDHLPQALRPQVASALRAAFRLQAEEGIAKLKQQAARLEREHPDAAGSLREGIQETLLEFASFDVFDWNIRRTR